ncbi:MAG: hypothetical protein J6S90_02860 [Lentisphaeria bacterium]|nr:hypothetical protein [Lentisphaeria bacterium]
MKHLFFVLLSAVCAVISAAEFRIDISGVKGTSLRPVSASQGVTLSQASWLGERKDIRMSCSVVVSKEWKTFSFTFLPKKDGKYEINLMGTSPKVKVCCDDIQAEGAVVKNGSFDKFDAKGNPSNWKKLKTPSITDGYSITTHNDRWLQTITCKQATPVTITFKARAL